MEHQTSMALQTLAVSIVAGVVLLLVSRRLQMSAIVLLLFGGMLLGPQMLGWVQPQELGKTLSPLISLAVALILFEGGLSLDLEGYKKASAVIRRLLSVGVMITWFGSAGLIYLFFHDTLGERPVGMSFLAASLVIVTGPTVIAPLLRRIRIKRNLHDILHWEGVLIDPIGVFIAILMYEYFTGGGAGEALGGFIKRVAAGLIVGGGAGFLADKMIRRKWIPEDNLNIFIVAVAVFVYALDDYLVPESGLLGVVVAGFVLGWRRPGPLKQIREFKAEISDLLIGALFILLAAQLEFSDFQRFGLKGLLLVLLVVFVIRPLSIFACSFSSDMTLKEKIFLSYVAPRGIVAASMASLFGISLLTESSWFLVTFTFSVIGFTVVLQGSTAGLLAGILGLRLPAPTGWLIVGAHPFGRRLCSFIKDRAKVDCVLMDSNRRSIQEARSEGYMALNADARDPAIIERVEFRSVGYVLALTDNEELNMLICQRWMSVVGRENVYRWATGTSDPGDAHAQPGIHVWGTLPKPSLVSSELTRHEAHLVISDASAVNEGQAYPLLYINEPQVLVDPSREEQKELVTKEGETLLLRREADYLQRSLRPEIVVRLHDIETKEQLFRELVERVTTVEPRLDKEAMISELIEREQSFSTALGHGVAVPHAYGRGVDRRLCAVAQIPDGIPFDAMDGQPVRLVFLLISPQGDPEGHLATMGEIARLVSDEEIRNQMVDAGDPADIVALIESSG